uniref:Uncharacterized protein n=1 Tax=viral metagenome TaxID=1070528 RepID=A0A6M3JXB3_9ZZZZ
MKRTKKNGNDCIKLRGSIAWALRNAQSGDLIDSGHGENVVLLVGRRYILNKLGADSVANLIDRIYLGTSTAAETNTHTGLQNSFASQTFNAGSSNSSSAATPYIVFAASWASNETHASSSAINEFGLYASTGTAVGRKTTASAINFSSTNTLSVSYTLSN